MANAANSESDRPLELAAGRHSERKTATEFGHRTHFRFLVIFLAFMSRFLASVLVVNMSVVILKMVKVSSSNSTFPDVNMTSAQRITTPNMVDPSQGEFDWSPKLQGFLFTAANAAACVGCIPGGRAAELIGPRTVIFISIICSSLSNLLTPWASRTNIYILMALQVINGLGMGATFSSSVYIAVIWVPRDEMAFVSSIVSSGSAFGSFVAALLSGALCEMPFLNGWPLVFYSFGAFGILYSILFVLLMRDDPQEHSLVRESEIKCILSGGATRTAAKLNVPWMQLLFSLPSFAVVYASFTRGWAVGYLSTVHPTYMKNILGFDVGECGALSSLFFLTQTASSIFFGFLSDVVTRRKMFNVDCVRKANNLACSLGVSASFLGLCFSGTKPVLNICLFVSVAAFSAFSFTGSDVAVIDMTPNFAGTLGGTCALGSSVGSFLVPLATGYFTNKEQSIRQWRYIFLMMVPVAFSGGLFFQIFGSAKLQPWDGSQRTPTKKGRVTNAANSVKNKTNVTIIVEVTEA